MRPIHNSTSRDVFFMILFLMLLLSNHSNGQIKLDKQKLNKITSPGFIQRTMHLLAESTPKKRNTVRILIYGQSLSAQDWWLQVKEHLEAQFPDANLIMDNKAIGGFSSEILIKTVKRDILNFYPDLVIFHVFGSDLYYEQVLIQMRSLSSTEIVIWNDPQNNPEPNEWHEEMSYQIIPSLAVKYKCMLIDIRTPIRELVKKQDLIYADEFTRDGTHFNEKGCELIANQIIPHLVFDKNYKSDPDGLLKTFEVGLDVRWDNGALILPFVGNRIDVITPPSPATRNNCSVFIDGKKPSEFPETYNFTRPNDNGEKGWIWSVGAPVRIRRKAPWINENFTLTFDSINYDTRFFTFHVEGSECGYEGSGNNRQDFLSNSGRVFIQANEVNDSIPGDWHVFRTFDITRFKVEKGYKTTWNTYLMGMDMFTPGNAPDKTIENVTTLFKGIHNGNHTLKLTCNGTGTPDITFIKVYKPFLADKR